MMDYATMLDDAGHPIITDYATVYPKGNVPKPRDRRLWPTIGRTVADRMRNYVKLCKQVGKELTPTETPGRYVVEWEDPKEHTRWIDEHSHNGERIRGHHATNKNRRRRTWRYEPGSLTLTNCTGWARFVQSDDTEREQLEGDTAKALEFWAMVRKEL